MSISLKLKNKSGLKTFQTHLSEAMQEVFSETTEAVIFESVKAAKEQVQNESRKPNSRTGRYLRSIHSVTVKSRFQVTGIIASNHPQAGVMEFGSRPHVIEARNKKALFWPGASNPVRKVNHPGTPAFRVLGGAVEQGLASTDQILSQMIDKKFPV